MRITVVTRHGVQFALNLRELSGALGDLSTLLPLMLSTIAVNSLQVRQKPSSATLNNCS